MAKIKWRLVVLQYFVVSNSGLMAGVIALVQLGYVIMCVCALATVCVKCVYDIGLDVVLMSCSW